MVKLVKNLQTALGERIDAQEWMSDSTKIRAHEKLAAFHVKVGYPDKWKDYSKLEIKNDSYWLTYAVLQNGDSMTCTAALVSRLTRTNG